MTSSDEPRGEIEAKASDATTKPCPACSHSIDANATRCPHCGLALGEHQRCPQCHAIADVEPSLEAKFVCSVCGGVRIPVDDPAVTRSTETLDLLRKTNVARSARATWRIVGLAASAFGVFSVMVLWLVIDIAHPIVVGAVVAAMASLVPFLFGAVSWKKSQERGSEIAPRLEKAWEETAADIARARGGKLDAPSLAKITRTSESNADQLLSRMSAQGRLLSSVTSEGGLQYTLVDEAQKDNAAP